jgi:hypothetical protein
VRVVRCVCGPGLTYDGHTINYQSGELMPPIHNFSAPSKESVHVALLALSLLGNERFEPRPHPLLLTPRLTRVVSCRVVCCVCDV